MRQAGFLRMGTTALAAGLLMILFREPTTPNWKFVRPDWMEQRVVEAEAG